MVRVCVRLVDSQVRNEHAMRTNRCVFFLGFMSGRKASDDPPEMWVHSSAIMTLSAATEKAEEERKEEALEYHAIFADEMDECKELSHRRQAPSFRAALVITICEGGIFEECSQYPLL